MDADLPWVCKPKRRSRVLDVYHCDQPSSSLMRLVFGAIRKLALTLNIGARAHAGARITLTY